MKVRWREHEILLISISAAIALVSYVWNWSILQPETMESDYVMPFSKGKIAFDYVSNIMLPQMAVLLLVYLLYLWINLFVLPLGRQMLMDNAAIDYFKKAVLILLQILVISYLFALGVNVATYYAHPYLINYGPNFRILQWLGYNDAPLTNLFSGFEEALTISIIYTIYAFVREVSSFKIERSGTKGSFKILVSNQLTSLLAIYLSIGVLLVNLNIISETVSIAYLILVPSILLSFMMNSYWLFPSEPGLSTRNSSTEVINKVFISRLLLSTFILVLPFSFLLVIALGLEGILIVFFTLWLFHLFIVTPLSYIRYRQSKDKILKLRGAERELLKTKADFNFLRYQINPHFLFNTLNTLYGTALMEKSRNTAEAIQKLGDMMRFMLHENNKDFIPLCKEIDYIKNYIELQKLRIQSSSSILIFEEIEDRHFDHQIAPMLLIPLIENAFKHGISLTEKSWIRIVLTCDHEHICFQVINSTHKFSDIYLGPEKSGVGLNNVIERLKIIYGGRHQLRCVDQKSEFKVNLSIQF